MHASHADRASRSGLPHVIVDCDPGIDDAIALLMLAALHHQGHIVLTAVTTVGGNVSLETATINTCFTLESAGLGHVPVYAGAGRSLSPPLEALDALGIHGSDGLGGCCEATRHPRAELDHGPQELARRILLQGDQHPTWILALGPLTNVALALDAEPRISSLIDRVVIMGGAFGHPSGNVTPWSEYNFHADPVAARRVCSSPLPLEIVPLDVTERLLFTTEDAQALDGSGSSRTLPSRLLEASIQNHRRCLGLDGCYLHDAIAAAILWNPRLACRQEGAVDVACSGERRGNCSFDSSRVGGRIEVSLALDLDIEETRKTILSLLSGDEVDQA